MRETVILEFSLFQLESGDQTLQRAPYHLQVSVRSKRQSRLKLGLSHSPLLIFTSAYNVLIAFLYHLKHKINMFYGIDSVVQPKNA